MRLDHSVMLEILGENIHDNRFLRLVRNMLRAGYLEDWKWNATLSGAPQGGVVSPILSNIYLHKLDRFVETVLIPEYTRGLRRKGNPAYEKVKDATAQARKRGDRAAVRALRKQLRAMPSGDPQDPGYRRLRYSRYADDHLLGFTGPKAEAEDIKSRLAQFLRDDLKLELSPGQDPDHPRPHWCGQVPRLRDHRPARRHQDQRRPPRANGVVALRVPLDVIKAKCAPYLKRGQPAARPQLVNDDDHTNHQHLRGRIPGPGQLLPAGR